MPAESSEGANHQGGLTIWSVGYERRTLDGLLALLATHQIEAVIDVRLNAVSRKRGFSKKPLARALAHAGIDYQHEPDLGNPQDNRDDFRRGSQASRRRYLDHLACNAPGACDQIVQTAARRRTALLCYEREHSACHRSCILDQAARSDRRVSVAAI